ncbi:MAG TPA: hypothetical protein PK299_02640 [Anaerolineales bacterium]|nr:hypothetical protein [Anaerolineales bacterium]
MLRSKTIGIFLLAVNFIFACAFLIYGLSLPFTKVDVFWETKTEIGTLGYHIYRSETPNSQAIQITQELIAAKGDETKGGKYSYRDLDVKAGQTYYYELEEVELNGAKNKYQLTSAKPNWYEKVLVLGSAAVLFISSAYLGYSVLGKRD